MAYADPKKQRESEMWFSMTAWIRRAPRLGSGGWKGRERSTKTAGGYKAMLMGDPCSYCGGEGGTIDHITARTAGGKHEYDNYTGACQSCNSSKHNVPLLPFLLLRPITEQQVELEYQRQSYLTMAPRRAIRQSSIRTVNTRPRPRR